MKGAGENLKIPNHNRERFGAVPRIQAEHLRSPTLVSSDSSFGWCLFLGVLEGHPGL